MILDIYRKSTSFENLKILYEYEYFSNSVENIYDIKIYFGNCKKLS
jgi:hypothetical protein